MVYPMGGTVDGARGDHVLLAPPFIIDAASVDSIVERPGDAIDAAIARPRNRQRPEKSKKEQGHV
jgi:adenosylmethionine-8-amino-7-oxononanoate aminotransferase